MAQERCSITLRNINFATGTVELPLPITTFTQALSGSKLLPIRARSEREQSERAIAPEYRLTRSPLLGRAILRVLAAAVGALEP